MKISVLVAALVGLLVAGPVAAPVAGSATVGVAAEELQTVYTGWSAKTKILGEARYNDTGEKIGTIEDLIVTPSSHQSFISLSSASSDRHRGTNRPYAGLRYLAAGDVPPTGDPTS